jgi:hypothetical protein
MMLKKILDLEEWFELDRFLDTLILPASVGVAFLILTISKRKSAQWLMDKLFNPESSLIVFREISGLKIFSIWNLLLGIGLIMFGFTYKKISTEGLLLVSAISFYGASLGWSYAFQYFEEAWKTKAGLFNKISFLFLVIAIIEKLVNIYRGNVSQASLFYFTIPPLILLLRSKTEFEKKGESKIFWLSSLTFNLVLVGVFFMDGVNSVKTKSASSNEFWLNLFLIIAPTLATYMSLINLQKHYKTSSENLPQKSKSIIITAFVSLIGLTLIASAGIKQTCLFIQNKKLEYKDNNESMIKEYEVKLEKSKSFNNPQQNP